MLMNFENILSEVFAAIEELHLTAITNQDKSRKSVAIVLKEDFSLVTNKKELRDTARHALMLYRGGMGSFQDVGDALTDHAVKRLARALYDARWTF